jgi:hypothetical protein
VYANGVVGDASVRLLWTQDRYFTYFQYGAAKAPSLLAGRYKILLLSETDDD